MLVSRLPSYTRGGPMPLAGPPCDLYTQLLAWSSLQSVVADHYTVPANSTVKHPPRHNSVKKSIEGNVVRATGESLDPGLQLKTGLKCIKQPSLAE